MAILEFHIDTVQKRLTDRVVVLGRLDTGVLRVGDRFTRHYQYQFTLDDMYEGRPLPAPSNVVAIELTVVAIGRGRRRVETVPLLTSAQGAELTLEGPGVDGIVDRSTLALDTNEENENRSAGAD